MNFRIIFIAIILAYFSQIQGISFKKEKLALKFCGQEEFMQIIEEYSNSQDNSYIQEIVLKISKDCKEKISNLDPLINFFKYLPTTDRINLNFQNQMIISDLALCKSLNNFSNRKIKRLDINLSQNKLSRLNPYDCFDSLSIENFILDISQNPQLLDMDINIISHQLAQQTSMQTFNFNILGLGVTKECYSYLQGLLNNLKNLNQFKIKSNFCYQTVHFDQQQYIQFGGQNETKLQLIFESLRPQPYCEIKKCNNYCQQCRERENECVQCYENSYLWGEKCISIWYFLAPFLVLMLLITFAGAFFMTRKRKRSSIFQIEEPNLQESLITQQQHQDQILQKEEFTQNTEILSNIICRNNSKSELRKTTRAVSETSIFSEPEFITIQYDINRDSSGSIQNKSQLYISTNDVSPEEQSQKNKNSSSQQYSSLDLNSNNNNNEDIEDQQSESNQEKVIQYHQVFPKVKVLQQKQFNSKFKFLENINNGAYGTVDRYIDIKNGNRQVAIKTLKIRRYYNDEMVICEGIKEALIQQELNKYTNNIVKLLDFFVRDSVEYQSQKRDFILVMELAEDNLEKQIHIAKKNKQFFDEETVELLISNLVSALKIVSDKNIVHRDIKPSNILFNEEYKLCDFGFARIINLSQSQNGYFSLKGTLNYLSPEQRQNHILNFQNKQSDQKKINPHLSDVFSLGLSIYEAVTLDKVQNMNLDENILNQKIQYMKDLRQGQISDRILAHIESMLEWDPEDRLTWKQLYMYYGTPNLSSLNINKTQNSSEIYEEDDEEDNEEEDDDCEKDDEEEDDDEEQKEDLSDQSESQ